MKNITKNISKNAVLILAVVFLIPQITNAEIIPADRVIQWQGNVGAEGGIRNRTNICATLNPGATAAQINSALSSCADEGVVKLSAGTYNLGSSQIVIPSNKTLRGAGPDATILTGSQLFGTVKIGGNTSSLAGNYTQTSSATISNINSGYTKGSTQITLASASGFTAGGFIWVDELNDTGIVDTPNCNKDCGIRVDGNNDTPTRAWSVIHKITAVNGNVLTIAPPAIYTFPSSLAPRAIKAVSYTQYAGLEDLQIAPTDAGGRAVMFMGAANSWVKNIRVQVVGMYGINLYLDCFRNEIRDSYFYGAWDKVNSNTGYAIRLDSASFNLSENNIFDGTNTANMLLSSSGNVCAYNYAHNIGRANATWCWMNDWTHGSHSAFNLFEGNYMVGLKNDYTHGSGSHNTTFRNRYLGKFSDTATTAVGAIITEQNNYYSNAVGNVLGLTGWTNAYEVRESTNGYVQKPAFATGIQNDETPAYAHTDPNTFATMFRNQNYDYFTKSMKHCGDSGEPGCLGINSAGTLLPSLYLSQAPAWYGSCSWPPVDPNGPTVNDIPAKLRYEGKSCGSPTCATADANCDGSVNISDVQVCINVVLGNDSDINHQSRCDLNGGGVNITDVQAVINKILNP